MVASIIMNNLTVSFEHNEERVLVPHAFKAVFSVAVSAVSLLSVSGNVLAITTFLKTQNLRTSTNYYITNMAVSDLLFVPSAWISFVSIFGQTVSSLQCILGQYSAHVSYSVSVESLVLITVDRFIATVFPMIVTRITRRIRACLILLTWIGPMAILVPYFWISRVAEETDGPHICNAHTSSASGPVVTTIYSFLGVVLLYCAPLIVIIILNARIMKSLRRPNPVIQGNDQSNRRHKQNQRIMKLIITIIAFFFSCWTPFYVFFFISTFFPKVLERNTPEIVSSVCFHFLSFVSTAGNPMILFTFSTNYRQALKNCLRLTVVKFRSCFVGEQTVREENVELPELQ